MIRSKSQLSKDKSNKQTYLPWLTENGNEDECEELKKAREEQEVEEVKALVRDFFETDNDENETSTVQKEEPEKNTLAIQEDKMYSLLQEIEKPPTASLPIEISNTHQIIDALEEKLNDEPKDLLPTTKRSKPEIEPESELEHSSSSASMPQKTAVKRRRKTSTTSSSSSSSLPPISSAT